MKYIIFRQDYPKNILEFCVEMIDKGEDYYSTRKWLLLHDFSNKDINEICWIYKKINSEYNPTKGGKK